MSREDFLQGLETSLSGNVPPAVVRENLHYYSDYIRTEMEKDRSETEVMEELGDPRLIARTIMDTTPEAGDGMFEEYHARGFYGRTSAEERGSYTGGSYEESGSGSYRGQNRVHYYDMSKWYWKVLAVVLVIAVVTVVITVVTGLLSLVIPLLPVIGLVIVIMWFVRGSGR